MNCNSRTKLVDDFGKMHAKWKVLGSKIACSCFTAHQLYSCPKSKLITTRKYVLQLKLCPMPFAISLSSSLGRNYDSCVCIDPGQIFRYSCVATRIACRIMRIIKIIQNKELKVVIPVAHPVAWMKLEIPTSTFLFPMVAVRGVPPSPLQIPRLINWTVLMKVWYSLNN